MTTRWLRHQKKKIKTGSDRVDAQDKLASETLKTENATVEAFDSMSKSFDDALLEFEQASAKMDTISEKRRYKRRR